MIVLCVEWYSAVIEVRRHRGCMATDIGTLLVHPSGITDPDAADINESIRMGIGPIGGYAPNQWRRYWYEVEDYTETRESGAATESQSS